MNKKMRELLAKSKREKSTSKKFSKVKVRLDEAKQAN